MSFESLLPSFSKSVITVGDVGVSYLMMAVGAGAFVAVMFVAGVGNESARGNLLLFTAIISGVSLLCLAISYNLLFSAAAAFLM